MQERCNSSAIAMELRLSCTGPSMYDISQAHVVKSVDICEKELDVRT